MARFFITYGNNTKQKNCFSVVERDDYKEARDYVFRTIGSAWAFLYTEYEWIKPDPGGTTQQEKFGLQEIPLQAHENY